MIEDYSYKDWIRSGFMGIRLETVFNILFLSINWGCLYTFICLSVTALSEKNKAKKNKKKHEN